MASVNRVILVGNLGKDPELRKTTNGASVANLALATTHRFQKADGTAVEETEWHKVVCFGRTAEACNEYLGKGRQIYVEGRLQTRKWEDPQGAARYFTEVVAERVQFLGRKENGNTTGLPAAGGMTGRVAEPPLEDLPF